MATLPVALSVTVWGDGPKTALLLHGLSSNAAGWWRLGPDLAREGYTVTAPDLRGHGSSPQPGYYSFDAFAADLVPLGDAWDLVLGHSLGGAVAVTAALAEPGWARKLILEDPALKLGDREQSRHWLLESYRGEMTLERLQREQPRWAPEDREAKVEAIAQSDLAAVHGFLDHNGDWDLYPDLGRLDVDTLLLGAGIDPIVGPEAGRAVAAANPRVRFAVIEGSSHSMHRDSYESFWTEVRSFL